MRFINDGQNQFSARLIPSWQILADVDGDADIDIIKNGAVWLENRPMGDVNEDGVFDSSDSCWRCRRLNMKTAPISTHNSTRAIGTVILTSIAKILC